MTAHEAKVVFATICFFGAGPALADTDRLRLYERAVAAGSECMTIPDPDPRQKCLDKNKEKNRACKGPKITCQKGDEDIAPSVRDIDRKLREIEKEKEVVTGDRGEESKESGHERTPSEVQSSKDRIAADEGKVTALKRELDAMVEGLKKLLEERSANGRTCQGLRNDVHDFFVTATAVAEGETDPKVKLLAAKLIARWKTSDLEHKPENDRLDDVIKFCNQARSNVGDYLLPLKIF